MNKQMRCLALLYRLLRGEALSVRALAEEFGVSEKTISRDLFECKAFFCECRGIAGNAELEYDQRTKTYRLCPEDFLTNQEMFLLLKLLLGTRALSREELLQLVEKLKRFTTQADRACLEEMIDAEQRYYEPVHHDCKSLKQTLWQVMRCIDRRCEITIRYYKMDRSEVTRRLCPLSILFSEYYFYLIAVRADDAAQKPIYFRIDRIHDIVEHRECFARTPQLRFNEGAFRRRNQYMLPGKERSIRFAFSGPSVQAVLDRLPTARIVGQEGKRYVLEAEVYGDGIKMFLLSQGSWVKVLAPAEFVEEMRKEIDKMQACYVETAE